MNRESILILVYDCLQKDNLWADLPEEVTEEDNISSFGLDSLDILSLAMCIEREIDISIADIEVESWVTLGDIINSIEKRI